MKKVRMFLYVLIAVMMMTVHTGAQQEEIPERSGLHFVFVHGLSGWGSYDSRYKLLPYWGLFKGDLIRYLNEQGFSAYAASVAPEGSAWDRACELYAQLTGTVVDYGKNHSEKYGHDRYGRDFSDEPLIREWSDGRKIVLLGHSFGGATVRLFSELLANGSEEERESTDPEELSGFFAGGQGERIHALVTLAAPTNGTTAYDMSEDAYHVQEDTAAFDMHIDHALALNSRITTLPGTYYFAVPCSATEEAEDGTWKPIQSMMEGMFLRSSEAMGKYTGTTPGGFVIDDSWPENDGLVNTVSAKAPLGAPSAGYDPEAAVPGIWYVMPTYEGDHMPLQGGMTKWNDIRPFYLELAEMIDALPR